LRVEGVVLHLELNHRPNMMPLPDLGWLDSRKW
jgi:hypothetical protein